MKAVRIAFTAVTAVFDTSTWNSRITSYYLIDKDHSAFQLQGSLMSSLKVLSEDTSTKAIAGTVSQISCLQIIVESKQAKNWSEEFLAISWLLFGYILNDNGMEEISLIKLRMYEVLFSIEQFSSLINRILDLRCQVCYLFFHWQRTNCSYWI